MKKHILTIFLGIIISMATISACKKDNNDNPAPAEKKCKITYLESEGDTSDILTYDLQDRLIKYETWKDGKIRYYYTYTYSPNTITETYYYDGKATETINHLNPNGTVNYSTKTLVDRADTTFYTYDTEGHNTLITYKYTSYYGSDTLRVTDTHGFKFSNGSVVSSIYTNGDGTYEESFYELSSIEDKLNIFTSGSIPIPGLYGKSSKFLISKETGEDYVDIISYEVNQDGLITKRKLQHTNTKDSKQNESFDTNINYACK